MISPPRVHRVRFLTSIRRSACTGRGALLAQWLRPARRGTRLPPSLDGREAGCDGHRGLRCRGVRVGAPRSARSLTGLDLRVLELNREVAYLDGEEKIIELATGNLIRARSVHLRLALLHAKVPMRSRPGHHGLGRAELATHPMAMRYANTLFLPGGEGRSGRMASST